MAAKDKTSDLIIRIERLENETDKLLKWQLKRQGHMEGKEELFSLGLKIAALVPIGLSTWFMYLQLTRMPGT